MYKLVCKDSVEGILSGIYEAWSGGYPRHEVSLWSGEIQNYELFTEYVVIEENEEYANKVKRTILRLFGMETLEAVYYAIWSDREDKADAVYHMVLCGIEQHIGKNLHMHLADPYIQRVFELTRMVSNEAHHYLGFLRFSELEQGILYAEIEPKHYVIEQLAEHFTDRLPAENWMIYDRRRQLAAIHQCQKGWLLFRKTVALEEQSTEVTHKEAYYRKLWKSFCGHISVTERENPCLQRQNLPLHFRKYMAEFEQSCKDRNRGEYEFRK